MSRMGKRQPSRAVSSRAKTRRLMGQVDINTTASSVAVTQHHHLVAAKLHCVFRHLLSIPRSHFPPLVCSACTVCHMCFKVSPCTYCYCASVFVGVCCRHSRGRRRFEHFVSADEGPVELAVHREHTEDHQAALWHLH